MKGTFHEAWALRAACFGAATAALIPFGVAPSTAPADVSTARGAFFGGGPSGCRGVNRHAVADFGQGAPGIHFDCGTDFGNNGIEGFLGPAAAAATAASGGCDIIGGIPGGRNRWSADLARWRDGRLAGSVRTVGEGGGSADLARWRDGHLAGSAGTVPACFAPADSRPFGDLGEGDLGGEELDEVELDEEESSIAT